VPANDGKEAEGAFENHWKAVGHVERLRDKRDLVGLNGGNMAIADFAKPSDFLVSSPQVPLHYAEVKSTQGAKGFAFGAIQPGQHKAAMLEASRGMGMYVFYIFSYATGKWFTMDCLRYAALVNEGRRSVKFEELEPWLR
jgi:hypothetical protein